jgi:hypothetical protein
MILEFRNRAHLSRSCDGCGSSAFHLSEHSGDVAAKSTLEARLEARLWRRGDHRLNGRRPGREYFTSGIDPTQPFAAAPMNDRFGKTVPLV